METSKLGDVSAEELCRSSGNFSPEQVGIDLSAPCTHESNSLDVNTAKNARSSRKVEEDKVTLCGVLSSCNVQKDTCSCSVFAFSGQNQAHNLTNMFYMNVLSNMNTGNGIQVCIFWVQCHPSDRRQQHQILFDAVAMKATASFIRNQAHNLKSIFYMNEGPFKHEYGQWNSVMYVFSRMPPF